MLATRTAYTIAPNGSNECTLTDHATGHVATYWAPRFGGYVRDTTVRPGTLGAQVCARLRGQGQTLYWDGTGTVAAIIRREARAAYRARN